MRLSYEDMSLHLHETKVPQMLNLNVKSGFSFTGVGEIPSACQLPSPINVEVLTEMSGLSAIVCGEP